ncbi:MAG: HlyD family secretion protein [Hyphomicrobiaceae bacterium]
MRSESLKPLPGPPEVTAGQKRDAPEAKAPAGREDALALQRRLARELPSTAPIEPPAAHAPAHKLLKPLPIGQSRLLKSVVGLVLVAVVGWMPVQRIFQISSVEAVVNAQVVTLRAPISGIVQRTPSTIRVGSAIGDSQTLFAIENPRADHNNFERVQQDLAAAREELAAIDMRRERTMEMQADIEKRLANYRTDRTDQLSSALADANAGVGSAQAILDRAELEIARQQKLANGGIGARTALETATRDRNVAKATLAQARARKASISVQMSALAAGRYLGDGYYDAPASVQRLDSIADTLILIQVDAARLSQRIARLEQDLVREKRLFDLASRAELASPVGGRIWEVFTTPGEEVTTGQPLVSVLDCSRLLVTAAVSEAVYNTLSVGMSARFTFREGGGPLDGTVVQLSGVAAAGSNFAILPTALTRESYRVSISIAGLPNSDTCPVGRTGRVVFGPQGA